MTTTPFDLSGKVAVVTGGNRGIGLGIVRGLAEAGAEVVVAARNEEKSRQVVREIQEEGGEALAVNVDVGDESSVRALVQSTLDHFGRLDILVNNAGIGIIQPLMDVDEASWQAQMDVNAKGTLLCTQAAARQMIAQGRGGRVINNASGAGKIAPGAATPLGAYAASKHAVVGLTRQFGAELAQHQILVNCLCAGIVDTEMWALIDREIAALEGAEVGSVMQRAVDSIPLGRVQQPADVANMVAFLASADASYSTGQAFNVSGGMLPY